MPSFSVHGNIADVDGTTPFEPSHPSVGLIIETGNDFLRVIVPDAVLDGRRELLCVDRTAQLTGDVIETADGAFRREQPIAP